MDILHSTYIIPRRKKESKILFFKLILGAGDPFKRLHLNSVSCIQDFV